MAEGPLPMKAEGRAFLTHRCPVANGRGCPVCSYTGYATVGFRFLQVMAERRAAASPAPPRPEASPGGSPPMTPAPESGKHPTDGSEEPPEPAPRKRATKRHQVEQFFSF